jgi:CRISPR-associated protein Cas1
MSKRVISISNQARLSLHQKQMVVQRNNELNITIPIEDIGVCICENPMISCTQALLSACAKENVIIIICDERHMPCSMIIPLNNHTLHSKIITQQSKAKITVLKQLWQVIIRAKILAQAALLEKLNKEGVMKLKTLAAKVRSGDPDNKEAQAAKIYWQNLFAEKFKRDPEGEGINHFLNYGYAIIRAAVARAIVGAGLHPALGIHHHNQYNAFCLADDLLEPFRPLVDEHVYSLFNAGETEHTLDTDAKKEILNILAKELTIGNQKLPLLIALQQYAASLKAVLCENNNKLEIPR